MARKKILLSVANIRGLNTGKGGHYYTVLSHYEYFKNIYDVSILVLGVEVPPAFKRVEIDLIHIHMDSFYDFVIKIDLIKKLLKENNIQLLHSFDSTSFLFVRWANLRLKLPMLFTKCGGAVTKKFTPRGAPDIVFHGEDLNFYCRRKSKYLAESTSYKIQLIPNRVNSSLLSQSQSQSQSHAEIFKNKEAFKILRIARICKKYKESLIQSINISNMLRMNGVHVELVIIGYLEDQEVFSTIAAELDKFSLGRVITTESYTTNAARFIPQSDAVVASGRGVMEAALHSKITLFCSEDLKIPIILDDFTVNDGIYFNFSERTRFSMSQIRRSSEMLLELIKNDNNLSDYQLRLNNIYFNYFDLKSADKIYCDLYNDSIKKDKKKSDNLTDLFFHSWFLLKGFIVSRLL